MIKRMISLAALAVLAACGSANDGTTFQAPAGYTQSMKVGPFMEVWNKGTNVVMLMALPTKDDLHKAAQSPQFNNMNLKQQNITICNGQEAIYSEGVGAYNKAGNDATSKKGRVEMIMTDVGSKMYMAMYRRDLDAPADPAVEASIKNVCPKT